MNNKEAGRKGENAAKELYVSKGYSVIATNYRFRRYGEIDLILSKDDLIVFCEVKYRSNPDIYSPAAAVVPAKIQKIRLVAKSFLQSNYKYQGFNVRFDVAEVLPEGNILNVNLLENAF